MEKSFPRRHKVEPGHGEYTPGSLQSTSFPRHRVAINWRLNNAKAKSWAVFPEFAAARMSVLTGIAVLTTVTQKYKIAQVVG